MTRSTCLGFLKVDQFTGPERRELFGLITDWMRRNGRLESPDMQAEAPAGDAIGIYWIRELADSEGGVS